MVTPPRSILVKFLNMENGAVGVTKQKKRILRVRGVGGARVSGLERKMKNQHKEETLFREI